MSREPIYINKTLGKDENVKWIADLHWLVWVYPTIWFVICLLLFLTSFSSDITWEQAANGRVYGVLFLLLAVYLWLSWKKTEYVVTNKRVISKSGIIAVKTEELRLLKVESVYIEQGIIGRIFDCGKIVFGGTGGTKVVFKYVRSPRQTKTIIEEIIGKE